MASKHEASFPAAETEPTEADRNADDSQPAFNKNVALLKTFFIGLMYLVMV